MCARRRFPFVPGSHLCRPFFALRILSCLSAILCPGWGEKTYRSLSRSVKVKKPFRLIFREGSRGPLRVGPNGPSLLVTEFLSDCLMQNSTHFIVWLLNSIFVCFRLIVGTTNYSTDWCSDMLLPRAIYIWTCYISIFADGRTLGMPTLDHQSVTFYCTMHTAILQ